MVYPHHLLQLIVISSPRHHLQADPKLTIKRGANNTDRGQRMLENLLRMKLKKKSLGTLSSRSRQKGWRNKRRKWRKGFYISLSLTEKIMRRKTLLTKSSWQ